MASTVFYGGARSGKSTPARDCRYYWHNGEIITLHPEQEIDPMEAIALQDQLASAKPVEVTKEPRL